MMPKCTIADICFDPALKVASAAEVQHLLHFLAATGVSSSGTITTTPSGTRRDLHTPAPRLLEGRLLD
jgi:hypothetical protein